MFGRGQKKRQETNKIRKKRQENHEVRQKLRFTPLLLLFFPLFGRGLEAFPFRRISRIRLPTGGDMVIFHNKRAAHRWAELKDAAVRVAHGSRGRQGGRFWAW